MQPIKNFISPKIFFRNEGISYLNEFINDYTKSDNNYVGIFVDDFFINNKLEVLDSIPNSFVIYVQTQEEPKTVEIDQYVQQLKENGQPIDCIVGIGGGIVMDVAKAVSIMMTNEGLTQEYQGWDLVHTKPLPKIGIPTIYGTGSEVSRTTVLTSPIKKQGINSIYSMFDQIILDPTLSVTVEPVQKFYTGMDCYIHSVESITGHFLNEFSREFADKALSLSRKVFLDNGTDQEMAMASMFGGYSIVYSEVGVCHALSYGISHVFGYHHGEANCIVFNQLEDYYGEYVTEFRQMLDKYKITLPQGVTKNASPEEIEHMVDMTLLMEKPLTNALGENWRGILTRDKIKELYSRM